MLVFLRIILFRMSQRINYSYQNTLLCSYFVSLASAFTAMTAIGQHFAQHRQLLSV